MLTGPVSVSDHVDGANMVVDLAKEVVLLALTGQDSITKVAFALTNGLPITPGLRGLPGIINLSAIDTTRTTFESDAQGRRVAVTFRSIWTPGSNVTYDTIGLLSANQYLVAAKACGLLTRTAGTPIATTWTLRF